VSGTGVSYPCSSSLTTAAKKHPPGIIDNYIDWLKPRLHGLDDPRYPSLVGL